MVRTKQTAHGDSSQRPEGMATAMFGGEGGPEEQFQDAPAEDIPDEDLPKVLEDAEQPKAGKPSTSKSEGKTGEQAVQATEGAQAPPVETPQDPTDPTPGTSKDPTSGSPHWRHLPDHRPGHRPDPRRGRDSSY